MILFRVISLLAGYLLGCFQTSYIIGKRKHIDIRQHGSGNAGTTNAIRVLGWKFGLLTFLGDVAKAVLAVVVMWQVFDSQTAGLYAGLGVVLGHNWLVFMKFRGGKGIASSIGILWSIDWRIGAIATIVLAVVILITKYVSAGSILMVITMPVGFMVFYPGNKEFLAIGVLMAVMAIVKHRANIGRLLKGEENKLKLKKSKTS